MNTIEKPSELLKPCPNPECSPDAIIDPSQPYRGVVCKWCGTRAANAETFAEAGRLWNLLPRTPAQPTGEGECHPPQCRSINCGPGEACQRCKDWYAAHRLSPKVPADTLTVPEGKVLVSREDLENILAYVNHWSIHLEKDEAAQKSYFVAKQLLADQEGEG